MYHLKNSDLGFRKKKQERTEGKKVIYSILDLLLEVLFWREKTKTKTETCIYSCDMKDLKSDMKDLKSELKSDISRVETKVDKVLEKRM